MIPKKIKLMLHITRLKNYLFSYSYQCLKTSSEYKNAFNLPDHRENDNERFGKGWIKTRHVCYFLIFLSLCRWAKLSWWAKIASIVSFFIKFFKALRAVSAVICSSTICQSFAALYHQCTKPTVFLLKNGCDLVDFSKLQICIVFYEHNCVTITA